LCSAFAAAGGEEAETGQEPPAVKKIKRQAREQRSPRKEHGQRPGAKA
jgi:hypothetical protein